MKKNLLTYLTALISGGIGVFAFSPFDQWWVTYPSLMGLLFVAKNPQKKTALLATFLWGVSFFSIGVSWLNVSIHQFGGAPLIISYLLVVLLSAYLALYPVLFTYVIQKLQVKSAVIFPIIWTFTEFLRGWVFTGFPWLQFGYTQIDSPFSGIAPIFGVQGLTFFTMWISAILLGLIQTVFFTEKKTPSLAANTFFLIVLTTLGIISSQKTYIKEQPEKAITVTLAQGNIEQQIKWDPDYLYRSLNIYYDLIKPHLGKSDLVVLPESAIPNLENNMQTYLDMLQTEAQETGTEIIIGTVYQEENTRKLFNSIISIGNKEKPYKIENYRYSKHHLVPFGEYVPMEDLLRPLGSVFNLPMSAFQSGDEIQQPMFIKNKYLTPAICYEIIFGKQLQENVQEKTDFILTISNDAWFGNSIGPWQHLQMARMRALELGKPVIRSTNTGISVFIDGKGKILAQAPQFIESSLTHKISPVEGKTPYAVLGDKPLYILSLLILFMEFVGKTIKRKLQKNYSK